MEPKRANETAAMYVDCDAAMADRKQFVANYGWLLKQTREGVVGAYLDDNEIVHVVFRGGHEKRVNVAQDSYMAIIRDVGNALR